MELGGLLVALTADPLSVDLLASRSNSPSQRGRARLCALGFGDTW